jgi:hypothetical protein
MDLITHNLPSELPKNEFDVFDKAMFQGVERQRELIFHIMGIEKSD